MYSGILHTEDYNCDGSFFYQYPSTVDRSAIAFQVAPSSPAKNDDSDNSTRKRKLPKLIIKSASINGEPIKKRAKKHQKTPSSTSYRATVPPSSPTAVVPHAPNLKTASTTSCYATVPSSQTAVVHQSTGLQVPKVPDAQFNWRHNLNKILIDRYTAHQVKFTSVSYKAKRVWEMAVLEVLE